ncbi:MAG TPA: hypothetical protein VF937_16565 [Chloroflexota bacterium]
MAIWRNWRWGWGWLLGIAVVGVSFEDGLLSPSMVSIWGRP